MATQMISCAIMHKDMAGFVPRLKAFLFDYVFILAYLALIAILSFVLNTAFPNFSRAVFTRNMTAELYGFVTATLPVILYFAFSEASSRQGTWGKQKVRLRVLSIKDSRSLSTGRSLTRNVLKFAPWELAHGLIWYENLHPDPSFILFTSGMTMVYILVLANLLMLIFTPKHQALYDAIAGTGVEKVPDTALMRVSGDRV